MKKKIIRFVAAALFSTCSFLLLGSLPIELCNSENTSHTEINNVNNDFSKALNFDFSELKEKNPLILLEFSVE